MGPEGPLSKEPPRRPRPNNRQQPPNEARHFENQGAERGCGDRCDAEGPNDQPALGLLMLTKTCLRQHSLMAN